MAWRGVRDDRGATAVEFAILLPLLLLIVCEIIAWSYMFSFRQSLSQAASEAARAAVGAPTTNCSSTTTWNVSTCVAGTAAAAVVGSSLSSYHYHGTALACGSAGLTCTIAQAAPSNCATGHTCITVTLSYPYRSQSLLPVIPSRIPPFDVVLPGDLSFTSVVEVS